MLPGLAGELSIGVPVVRQRTTLDIWKQGLIG
jgi:hypothetical protein